jgi:hypothetical protein
MSKFEVEGTIGGQKFCSPLAEVSMCDGDETIPVTHHLGENPTSDEVVEQVRSQLGEETEVHTTVSPFHLDGTLEEARVYERVLVFDSNG